MKLFIRFILLFVVFLNIAEAAEPKKGLQPQLALSPSRVEIDADEGRATKSVTVLNLGNESMRVQVSVQNWDFDQNNNYRALPPNEQSLDQWLIINPVQLEIPAKGQQTVRMAVRPRAKPEDGEHRAMVFFRQINAEEKEGVNVLFNIGVPVYAYFGDVQRTATLHGMSFDPEKQSLTFDITNTGNAYVRPEGYYMLVNSESEVPDQTLLARLNAKTGEVSGSKPFAMGKIASKPVFAGERRQLAATIAPKEDVSKPYKLVVKAKVAEQLFGKVYTIKNDK
ncbi:fimbrial biogenesis chaperone [Kangiella shandongensis]|uniref:fimbrial biogenesis chaperone n=1 Tax=Kangiella shandongensis TaxID=2763258 RepID=UPI001CC11519|nr:fimbria/pilus periplasmic chaperone [Kangiella shandongensis]